MHPQISITRRQLLAGCTVLAAQMGSDALWAQEVVKVLVGFPAGGAIDATARVYSNATRETLIYPHQPRCSSLGVAPKIRA